MPDPGPLLDLLPARDAVAWVRDGEGLVGWGEAARVELSGPDQQAQARDWWARLVAASEVVDEVGLPGSGLVCFGSFAFDPLRGTSVLVVPEIVVGSREGSWFVTRVGEPSDRPTPAPVRAPGPVAYQEAGTTAAGFEALVAEVVGRIARGEVAKVVLARDVVARTTEPLDVRWPLHRLADRYTSCWTFAVDRLFGATPELLVGLRGGVVTSRVLAGTIPRTGDDAADAGRAEALAASAKDLEEHVHGVASVRAALTPLCTAMDVPEVPFVLPLPNVLHLATDVSGVAADGTGSLDLLAALHPTAAVCGTPTAAALEVLREVEALDRGRYAGPVGWTDARGDGEWGIALRCAQIDAADPRRVRLFAGCGIVASSDPATELAESEAKTWPVREALGD
ncbi:MAG: isochorismate synthase [Frankiales bacterium]|nr:isochorismate synthase [Frankiales bacterium]